MFFSENCICRLMQWSCWNKGAVDASFRSTCHRRQLLFIIHSFSMCLLMLIIGGLVWFGGSLRTRVMLKLLAVRHVCSVFVWLIAAVAAKGVLVQVSVLLFLQLIFRTLLLTMCKTWKILTWLKVELDLLADAFEVLYVPNEKLMTLKIYRLILRFQHLGPIHLLFSFKWSALSNITEDVDSF